MAFSSSINTASICSRPAVSTMTVRQRAFSASRRASRTRASTPFPFPVSPFPGNTGPPICSPSCRSCSSAAGRYGSAATNPGAFCSSLSRRASLAAVVVLPEPCRPTSRITVGPTDANSRGAARCAPTFRAKSSSDAPSMRAISSRTNFTTCWPGLTVFRATPATARSRTRSTNPCVTSKLTSASSRWRRISRRASVTSCCDSTPRPVTRFRTAASCDARAVNISPQNYLARWWIPSGGDLPAARPTRIAGTWREPDHRAGASTSGTTGTPPRTSCLISPRRPLPPPHHAHAAQDQLVDLGSPHRRSAGAPFRPGVLEPAEKPRSRGSVVPQGVPDEHVGGRAEHAIAVPVPAGRDQRGGTVVAQVLLEQQADLELAEAVLVAHGVGTGSFERQPVGPIAHRVAGRVENLLSRDRHQRPVRLLAGVLPVEPAHELRTPEVREDDALAQPERRAAEHLHALLLRAQCGAQVPEVGQALDPLLRHQHQDLGQRRLALEDGLGGGAAVILALELDQ